MHMLAINCTQLFAASILTSIMYFFIDMNCIFALIMCVWIFMDCIFVLIICVWLFQLYIMRLWVRFACISSLCVLSHEYGLYLMVAIMALDMLPVECILLTKTSVRFIPIMCFSIDKNIVNVFLWTCQIYMVHIIFAKFKLYFISIVNGLVPV